MSGPISPTAGEPPLVDKCDGCGRPDGIWIPHRSEHVCPRCTNMYDTMDMAHAHLEELLSPTVRVWQEYWAKRGLTHEQTNELLENFGERRVPAWDWTH